MKIFENARVKLTAWYLLVIMSISLLFSVILFLFVSKELETGFRRFEVRIRAEELGIPLPPNQGRAFSFKNLPEELRDLKIRYEEEVVATKKKVFFALLEINTIILVTSAGLGYVLAGKSLKPIEEAMEEQKRFVADASHELKTPLASLQIQNEVALRDKKFSVKKAKEALKSNLADVKKMSRLTENLLERLFVLGLALNLPPLSNVTLNITKPFLAL